MPEPTYDGLAIVDGDNTLRGVQKPFCREIDIARFTAFVREQLARRSTQNPLLIWCQTMLTSDPSFSRRSKDLKQQGWTVKSTSGIAETDPRTGAQRWRGLPDTIIMHETRLAMSAYRMRDLLLASGDGYFIPLIKLAQEHYIHTIVLAVRASLNRELRAVANEWIELDQHIEEIVDTCAQGSDVLSSWQREAKRQNVSRGYPLFKRRRRHGY